MSRNRQRIMSCVIIFCLAIGLLPVPASADEAPFKLQSKSALLMDYDTGTVLYEKNIHEKLPIASITKIMTILLGLEAIDDGIIKLDDKILVSEHAASMGGSQVFLAPGENISVDSIMKAIIVASGNDASVALAEKIAGTEEVFVQRMNQKAKELGMNNTNFVNCHGLPAANHHSTAYDIALMSRELLKHPLFFRWSTIWLDYLEEAKNNTMLANTNRLIRFYDGADGIKTGSTSEAGYCIAATAKRGNMRLISVILAAPSTNIRFAEAGKLLDYGFANYESLSLVKEGQIIEKDIKVLGGKESSINGLASKDLSLLIRKGESKEYEKKVILEEGLKAPIKKGDKIGELVVEQDGRLVGAVDIVADRAVNKASIFDYFSKIFNTWLRKKE